MKMDPIISVSSGYQLKRTITVISTMGFTLICKPNPSRWALRIIGDKAGSCWASPFNNNIEARGFALNAGDDWHTYLSRDPVLTGLAWYTYWSAIPFPDAYIEVWETTPVGT